MISSNLKMTNTDTSKKDKEILSFWHKKWSLGRTKWHESHVNL